MQDVIAGQSDQANQKGSVLFWMENISRYQAMTGKYTIMHNESNHRFEMLLPGDPAYIQYSIHGDVLALHFIFVPPAERGKGLSGILIEYALNFAKERELKFVVYCSFIRRYMEVKGLGDLMGKKT